jgi:hypothetical protein
MYYEPQYPLGIVNLSPIPSDVGSLTFPGLFAMSGFADLTTDYAMAQGQVSALETNLAIALNPYFGGSVISAELALLAQLSKSTLMLSNRPSRAMLGRTKPAAAQTGRGGAAA